MKYLLLLSGLLLSGAGRAWAQAPQAAPAAATPSCSSLSGYVVGNEQPLAGATVSVPGTRLLTITNGEGYFTLLTNNLAQPKLLFSAAGYEPQTVSPTSCIDMRIELQLLPGTRIKQRGKRKGFIMKTGSPTPAQ